MSIEKQTITVTPTEKVTVHISRERMIRNFMMCITDQIIDSGYIPSKDCINQVLTALNPYNLKDDDTGFDSSDILRVKNLFSGGLTYMLLDDMECFEKDVLREIIITMAPGKRTITVFHEDINF